MKVYNETNTDVFIPITLKIRLQSQEEVDAILQLCNYVPLVDWTKEQGVSLFDILNSIRETHSGDVSTTSIHTYVKNWIKAQCNLGVKYGG
jgi:hypothetical protein